MKPSDVKITPPELWERVCVFADAAGFSGIVDVCTQPYNPLGASDFWTEQDDGLSKAWLMRSVLYHCNPPYSRGQIEKWVRHAVAQQGASIMLTPADFTTRWFRQAYEHRTLASVLSKRIAFLEPTPRGEYVALASGAKFGCVVWLFGADSMREPFCEHFVTGYGYRL